MDNRNNETLEGQVNRLATFIMSECEGYPNASEGAIDCAIRIIKDLRAELSRLSEPKNGIEPRQSTECEPDKKVMSVEVKCPACESEDIFTVIQRHHKCRGCGIRFCTDMDGNRRNYATLDEAMESHVFTGRNVTNKPTDEEIEEADRICLNCCELLSVCIFELLSTTFLSQGSNFSSEIAQEALLKFIQHELEIFTDTWVYNSYGEDERAEDFVKRYLKNE